MTLPAGAQNLPATESRFLTLHELVKKARQKLNHDNWDYIVGGTETETTVRRNRLALDSLAFRLSPFAFRLSPFAQGRCAT